jgi:hypothetical protein
MTIRPVRTALSILSVAFGLILASCVCLTVLGLLRQDLLVVGVFGSATAGFGLLLYAGLTASLIADESTVGRTRPWPIQCRRADLAAIRLTRVPLGISGPALAPAWTFVRTDGSTAFTVSPFMFPEERMRPLAEYLRVPLDLPG